MPQSRKRHGHQHQQKSTGVPSSQRTKGRIIWAILFAVFGIVISFFAAGDNYVALVIGAAIGAVIGYLIGKNMEQAASQ
jgi:uncharacterized membrane protein YqgA involved in biofilm formation